MRNKRKNNALEQKEVKFLFWRQQFLKLLHEKVFSKKNLNIHYFAQKTK